MNTSDFLADPRRYFEGAYKNFCEFGGPCVYFHDECLRAGKQEFLSKRHIEMLYATLTAWGMHRMGEGKTKLSDWRTFRDSILGCAAGLSQLGGYRMLDLPVEEYSDVVRSLRPSYERLELSVSDATVVINSKALYHLLPELIPPIDRQYTFRFFKQHPSKWRDSRGRSTTVTLPAGIDQQFKLFHEICVDVKKLADGVGRDVLDQERLACGATPPKAIDNAIVNYIKCVSGARPDEIEKVTVADAPD